MIRLYFDPSGGVSEAKLTTSPPEIDSEFYTLESVTLVPTNGVWAPKTFPLMREDNPFVRVSITDEPGKVTFTVSELWLDHGDELKRREQSVRIYQTFTAMLLANS